MIGYHVFKCDMIVFFITVLVTVGSAFEVRATPYYQFQGTTAGHVTSSVFNSSWVVSWPAVGDEVLFDYTFSCWEKDCWLPAITTKISVPAFSRVAYQTVSGFDPPFVQFDESTREVWYAHPFGTDIPDDWFRFRPGVEYQWWQEILTVQGRLGGDWEGRVYYYYSVTDWTNELFDTIEGVFTFETKPVPEPASMTIFGVGLALLALARRQRYDKLPKQNLS